MFRSFGLGRGVAPALLAVGYLLLAGCTEIIDHGVTECGPASCAGCCNALGQCQPGDSIVACGAGGLACATCATADRCEAGACVATDPDPDPPDGGTETTCGPSSCAGCCEGGTCVALADQSATACGLSGAACIGCGAGYSCEGGVCRSVPACDLRTSVGESLDFGTAGVGVAVSLNIELWNAGAATCELNPPPLWNVSADRNAFSFGEELQPADLAPGARMVIPVLFNPYAVRAWTDSANAFTFTVNDGATSNCPPPASPYGCRRVIVTGRGIENHRQVSTPLVPERVDFGPVQVGCESPWREVLWVNGSTQNIKVSDVSIIGADFELAPVVVPQTLPPFGTVRVRVRFVPSASGVRSGTVNITDEVNGTRTVALQAQATAASGRTDSFTQTAAAFTDVLFVVHEDPSSESVQDKVAAAAQSFIQDAQAAGGTWRLGVITSDATQATAGRLQGSPRFVTPGTPNAAAAFGYNIQVGPQLQVDQSLETTRLALLPPVSDDPLRNGGFLREDARLAVVAITNKADKYSNPVVSDHAAAIAAAIGQPLQSDRFRAWLISASGCSGTSRFSDFTNVVGGGCKSLVGVTMQSALHDVALDVFRERNEFILQAPVDGLPSSVGVDGYGVPATGYTFNAGNNALQFNSGYLPEPGQKIDVTYAPRCHP